MNRNRYSFAKTSGVSKWKHLCRPLSPPWPPTRNTGQTFSPEASVCVTKVLKDCNWEGNLCLQWGSQCRGESRGFPSWAALGKLLNTAKPQWTRNKLFCHFPGPLGKGFFFFKKKTKTKQNKTKAYGKGLDRTGNLMGIGHNVLPKWRYIGLSPYHYSDEPVV